MWNVKLCRYVNAMKIEEFIQIRKTLRLSQKSLALLLPHKTVLFVQQLESRKNIAHYHKRFLSQYIGLYLEDKLFAI